jgi:arsenate reductase
MAEAYLRKYGEGILEPYSAGFNPVGINPYTVKVLEEKGIDISSQRSKSVEEYLGKIHFGYVITVCKNAESVCPTFPGITQRIHWDIDDPASVTGSEEKILSAFRNARHIIESKVKAFVKSF